MRWTDVDLGSAWWTMPAERSKSRRTHRVPLTQLALEIISSQKFAVSSSYVFPASRDAERPILLPTVQRTVMKLRPTLSFSTHTLRHTVATHLSGSRVPRVVLKRILNHRERDITANYDHHYYDTEAGRPFLEGNFPEWVSVETVPNCSDDKPKVQVLAEL